MAVQKKRYSGPRIDFGRGAFAGFDDYRYGPKKPSKAKLPGIAIQKETKVLSQAQRAVAVDRLATMMQHAEPSPWSYEGPAREGLRLAMVEAGNAWRASDSEAERIIAGAFSKLGKTVRPTWEEGQRYVTTGPDQCLWCQGPLDDEDKVRNRRFCCADCARASQVHWDYESSYSLSPLAWHAGYILRLDRAETKLCAVPSCGKPFKTTSPNAATCSPACAKEWQSSKLEKRHCLRCNKGFQPMNEQALYCTDRCLHLAKEARKKAKRHEAIAEQPERICENPRCGKAFRPRRIGRASDRFCCEKCRRAAEYQRLKGKTRERSSQSDATPKSPNGWRISGRRYERSGRTW